MIQADDFILPNGFKCIYAFEGSNPIVCLQLIVKTGSVCETVSNLGYSHMIEHLVFKHTQSYHDNQLSDLITYKGGFINAYTEYDTTCYYILIPKENLTLGINILSELAYKAVFTKNSLVNEKDIIIEELKQYANEPESAFIDWIQSVTFTHNPLKNPVLGNEKTILSATVNKLSNFYKTNYQPANAYLVVTGVFKLYNLRKQVTRCFSDWHNMIDTITSEKYDHIEKHGFRLFSLKRINRGEYLAFTVPELQESHPHNYVQTIITKAFAAGNQSRLYKRLVQHDKTALSIKLYSISGVNPGITVIQVIPVSADVVPDIIYSIYDEWQNLVAEPFTTNEIELVKKELIYTWYYDFEYIESISGNLASEEISNGYNQLYSFPDSISAITENDINTCLNQYWRTDYIAIFHQGESSLPGTIAKNITKLYNQWPIYPLNNLHSSFKSVPTDLCSTFVSGKSARKNLRDFDSVILDCGMQLLMRKVIGKPVCGVSLSTITSQLTESLENIGLNYLTSNLLLFGTAKHDYDQIQKICLSEGFNLKVSHSLETTSLKGKCLTFRLGELLNLTAEILSQPIFPARYLKFIKSHIYDSLRKEKASPFNNAYNSWNRFFLGRNTNLNKPFGNMSQTKARSILEINDWFATYYAPDNFKMAITGDFDFDRAADTCNNIFSSKHQNGSKPFHQPFYQLNQQRGKSVKTNSDQSNLILGAFSSPAEDIKGNTAFFILSQILGGELSSRFFSILREQYGYAYQTGFDFTSMQGLGFWYAYAICDKKDQKHARDTILEILSDIRKNGVTMHELESAKNYLKGMHRFDMESLSWQAGSLSLLCALGFDYEYFLARESRIDSVTREDIMEIMSRWFDPADIRIYQEI